MPEQKIIEILKNAKSVLLCTDEINSDDKAYALSALYTHFTSLEKSVSVIIPAEPVQRYRDLLKDSDINFTTKADPVNYIVSIDYTRNPVEKVSFDIDDKSGKIMFYITPKGKEFDFDNVEYKKSGSDYDMTICIGIDSFEDLGDLFKKNPALFKKNKTVVLSRQFSSQCESVINVANNQSVSEAALKIIQDMGSKVAVDTAQLILNGIISHARVLEGCFDNTIWRKVSLLSDWGAKPGAAFEKVYFSKTDRNLMLVTKLMTNIHYDSDKSIVWSKIMYEDINELGLGTESLDLSGRIAFNISKDYKLAVAVYEIEKNELTVYIESNNTKDYSAIKVASVFDGNGSDKCARFVIKNASIQDFENIFFPVLTDVFGIK